MHKQSSPKPPHSFIKHTHTVGGWRWCCTSVLSENNSTGPFLTGMDVYTGASEQSMVCSPVEFRFSSNSYLIKFTFLYIQLSSNHFLFKPYDPGWRHHSCQSHTEHYGRLRYELGGAEDDERQTDTHTNYTHRLT